MEGARRVPGWTPVDFFILRHGQTTWNARGIIQGQADAPLDDVGRAQARALAEFLVGDGLSAGRTRGFPRPGLPVVTSDLSRAVDTARVLADEIYLRVVSVPVPLVFHLLSHPSGRAAAGRSTNLSVPRSEALASAVSIHPESTRHCAFQSW